MQKSKNVGYGKVILFGEHFVVYGLPGIAAAMEDYTTAKVEKGKPGTGVVFSDNRPETPGYKETKLGERNRMMELMLKYLNIDPKKTPLKITLSGTLRCTSGNGSSAAMATAIARALSEHFGLGLNENQINDVSYEGEKGSAGTPSGIDNTCATYGGIIIFRKNLSGGPNKIDKMKVGKPIHIVIANTGITQETKLVVEDVKRHKDADPKKYERIFSDYNKVFESAKKAIEKGDMIEIGRLMDRNQELLREITVSCPEIEKICKIAKTAGAIGAKLTGTGRGGSVVLLAADETSQEKIAKAVEKIGFKTMETRIGV
jgi:mevalonate kinase